MENYPDYVNVCILICGRCGPLFDAKVPEFGNIEKSVWY